MKHFHLLKDKNGRYSFKDQDCEIYTGLVQPEKHGQSLTLYNAYHEPIIVIHAAVNSAFSLFRSHKELPLPLQMEEQHGQLIWKQAQLHWQLPANEYRFMACDRHPYADLLMSDDGAVLGYAQGSSGWLKSSAYSAPFAAVWMLIQERNNIHFVDEKTLLSYRKEVNG